MRRMHSAGLNSRHLIPKTLRSCLGPLDLPYDWNQKLVGILLALCFARSLLLKDLARCMGRPVKNGINSLSSFLSARRLDFSRQRERLLIGVLKRIGSRRLYLYRGKVVVIIDNTAHEKRRSRGKKRRMPSIGKVVLKNLPSREKILAPGYQEIWIGVLLKNRTCLGLTRFLFSDKVPWFRSQGLLEEIEIRKIQHLIRKALGRKVILVGARKFRVFACWKSIDRLLDLAHMAFLVLYLLFVLSERSRDRVFRRLRRSVDALLRQRSIRPPEITIGKFFEAIAIDFIERRHAWEVG